jgi:hypothetical protein
MSHHVWNMKHNRRLQFPRTKPFKQSLVLGFLPLRFSFRLPLHLLFRILSRFGFKFLARLIIFDLSQSESGV